ncbi:FKBP-type peptidyl-prolyl cis-trans isomerase [Tessaracoccus sp. Z1128]
MTFSARSLRRAVLAIGAASLIALTACADPEASSSPSAPAPSASASASPSVSASASASAAASVTPSADLSLIEVSDDDTPVVTVPAPWGITSTQSSVLRPGGAQQLTDTSIVTLNYVGVNGTSGEIFDSSYERGEPATFSLDGVVAGFQEGLVGQAVGSRVLIAMPSEDGYPEGTQDGSIAAGDSIVFVVDILSANFDDVTGEEVAPAAGLPAVTMTDGKPEVAVPAGAAAPTELVVQPLVKGPGAAITEASTIQVRYRAWTYDGALWQDAWQPQEGPLANLIAGWTEGLAGQTGGSRVMLVVPPAKAYPDGVPQATPPLAPGQTLIYVIDVLNVQG